MQNITKLP